MTLFEPFEELGFSLSNRIAFRSVRTGLADDGEPTDALASHLAARAAGGAGLVVGPADMLVHPSTSGAAYIDAYDRTIVEGLQTVVKSVHEAESSIVGQLTHPGAEETGDWEMQAQIAPSPVASNASYELPKAAERSEREALKQGFVDAAKNLERAGFDGIELSAGPNAVLRQFLSPKFNTRADEYNGDWESRARFVNETLERVGDAVAIPVGLHLSLAELVYGGYDFGDVPEVLDALAGFDYLSWTVGTRSTFDRTHAGTIVDAPTLREHADTVLEHVDVPVMGREPFTSQAAARELLDEGVDLVSITRPLLADEQAVNRWKRDERATSCIECNQKCLEGIYGHAHGGHVECVVNPRTGRETEFQPRQSLSQAPIAKSLLVIGGGPAGLRFAATAASRGHDVTIREASGELGGQLNIAERGPLEAFSRAREDLVAAVEEQDVTIQLHEHVSASDVCADWDEIIVATGANVPDLRATFDGDVVNAFDILAGHEDGSLNGDVLLYDRNRWIVTNLTGLRLAETADTLEIATRDHYPGFQAEQPNLPGFVAALQASGAEFKGQHALDAVAEDGTVTLRNTLTGNRVERTPDTVVVAGRRQTDESLYYDLQEQFDNVHRIGDAVSARKLDRAYYDAERLARRI